MGRWIKSSKHVFTPGGDPLWKCSECYRGEHVYGIESCESKEYCPDCGSRNLYPWEMICKNCKYFHKLKYGFETGKGFKESSCCIALTRIDEDIDDYKSFVVETNENSRCEMFFERGVKNRKENNIS